MKKHRTRHIMKLIKLNIWVITMLMAMVGINTAYADEKDMGTWSNNPDFGQNGANLTWDGYSLWDGQSFQNYEHERLDFNREFTISEARIQRHGGAISLN